MMASEQDDTVFHEEDQDLEDDEESSEDDDLEENDVLPDEEEEEDDEDLNSASASIPTPAITVAFPSSVAAATSISASAVTVAVPPSAAGDEPDQKRQRVSVQEEKKKQQPLPQQLDESRRLFQRLWTDEDEIGLLQGFLDYTSQRGNVHHHDTALFYDQIKSKLQLDFNKNQLVEKLRRLKKKYRNVLNKIDSGKDFAFKTAHDQATFEISRKIWDSNNNNNSTHNVNVLDDEDANHNNNHVNYSNEAKIHNHHNSTIVVHSSNNHEEKATPRSRKRSRSKAGVTESVFLMNNCENANTNNVGGCGGGGNTGNNGIAGVVEETVRSCLSPLFKELLSNVMGGVGGRGIGGLAMNAVMPLGLGGAALSFGGCGGGEVVNEKWRKQQILELEVYSKRLELVQDQIKVALEELRSMGG